MSCKYKYQINHFYIFIDNSYLYNHLVWKTNSFINYLPINGSKASSIPEKYAA